jgi:hypothetical protein
MENAFLLEIVGEKRDLPQKLEKESEEERPCFHLGREPVEKVFSSPQLISLIRGP